MFLASKIAWTISSPTSLVLLLAFAGLIAAAAGWRKTGLRLVAVAASLYLILAFSPLGNWLLTSLERRVQPVSLEDIAGASGIIVLGGANMVRSPSGKVVVHNFGGRIESAVELAKRFPEFPIIFSGGNGLWLLPPFGESEAQLALVFAKDAGIDPSRIRLETRSRNTYENAVFTAELLKPKPQEKWVLVTSAFHMPRAKALFEAQGFQILPWPTDYQARFSEDCRPRLLVSEPLCRFNVASKEWVGQTFYWLRGDIAHL